MNENWHKLKQWWDALAQRERWMLSAGGTFLGIFIFYTCFYSPVVDHLATLREEIVSQQTLLAWMRKTEIDIKQREKQGTNYNSKINSSVALLTLLQKQIDHAGLAQNLTQMKQRSSNDIELHFQKVEFDKLSKFIIVISKEYAVTINKASITVDDQPGMVNADFVVKIV